MTDAEKLVKVLEIEMNRVNHLDTVLFNIKVWTTTLVVALVAFVLGTISDAENTMCVEDPELLYLAIAATFIFFLVDLYFRRIQLSHVDNCVEIKRGLKSFGESLVWRPLWNRELSRPSTFRQRAVDYGYTLGFYGVLVLALSFLYFCTPSCVG